MTKNWWEFDTLRAGGAAGEVDGEFEAVVNGMRWSTASSTLIATQSFGTSEKQLRRTTGGRFFVKTAAYIHPVDEITARDLFGYPYAKQVVTEEEAFGRAIPLA